MAIIRQIILASFFAASVFAAPAITLEKHTAEGQMQNAFTQLDGKWVFVKNSNYFDKKEESLGEFSIKNPESLEKPTEALEKLYKALQKSKEKLGKPPQKEIHHQTHYRVGEFVIDRKHAYFKKAAQIFQAMKFNARMKLENGLKIDREKYAKMVEVNEGKVTNSQPFKSALYCVERGGHKVCDMEKQGVLFLTGP